MVKKISMGLVIVVLFLAMGVTGCRSKPALVGNYHAALSAEQKKLVLDGAGETSADLKAEFKKAEDDLAKVKLKINADGTCQLGENLERQGKWTAHEKGLVATFGSDKITFAFNDRDKTLSATNGKDSVFQKDE